MFLSRNKLSLVGLDISSTSVKLLELKKTGSSYRIESMGIEPLPVNAVVEKSIAEVESVAESVKRAVDKSKTKSRNVAIAVAGSSVITKKMTMPAGLSETEMEERVLMDAEQHIPYPLEEINLDFQVQGINEKKPDTVDVLLAACRSENIDGRVAAVELAGLTAKIVDVETNTIETVFSVMAGQMPDEGMNKTIAIVDIGATMTSLSVVRNHKLIYTREQYFGGKQLTEEIMRRYGLSYEEAGLAKRKGGLPNNYDPEVLQPFKETTAQQVSRFLQFFYSAGEADGQIDHMVLAGGTASLPGLAKLTASNIGVPTTIANPFNDMSTSSKVNKASVRAEAPSFLVATGLAIRGAEF